MKDETTGTQQVSRGAQVIGLTTIWREAEGATAATRGALAKHVLRRVQENVVKSPLTSLLTVFTIGVSLFILGLFLLLLGNVRGVVDNSQSEVTVSIYLREGVPLSEASMMASAISKRPGVRTALVRDKAAALTAFRKALGPDAAILDGLEETNPLPVSVEVSLYASNTAESTVQAIDKQYAPDKRVEYVRYSNGLLDQLKRIVRVLEVGGTTALIVLLVVTGFIIANTIKLALYSHRAEIEIMQLVGAGRVAIQAPYILEGLLQGVLGAFISIFLVLGAYLFFSDIIARTEMIALAIGDFRFLSFGQVLLLFAAGTAVGMLGSFLAVRRFLKDE